MKKLLILLLLIIPSVASAQIMTTGGGTGSTTPSGILYFTFGNLHASTLALGTGLSFSVSTTTFGTTTILSSASSVWPFPNQATTSPLTFFGGATTTTLVATSTFTVSGTSTFNGALVLNATTSEPIGNSFLNLVVGGDGVIRTAPVINELGDVLDNTLFTPPASPSVGDAYLLSASSTLTGAWVNATNTIATWQGSSWSFYTPNIGDRTSVTTGVNAGNIYTWNGTYWIQTTVSPSTNWAIGGNTFTTLTTTQKLGTLTNNPFGLYASSSLIETLLPSGNVGIGTSTPFSLFSIGANGTSTGINFTLSTSTFNNVGGINLTSGCFAITGTCISGGAAGVGPAGAIQLSNGSGGLVATSTFSFATSTNIFSLGSPFDPLRLFSTTTASGLSNSIYLGNSAGSLFTVSVGNTGIGALVLSIDTTGGLNTAIGDVALRNNTTGNQNTAVGVSALSANSTGSNNTAVGYSALTSATTTLDNDAFGMFSQTGNKTGSYNDAMGYFSLGGNVNGSQNIAFGFGASQQNVDATNTVAIGYGAGIGTGNYNNQGGVYLGFQSGNQVTTGSNFDTLLGYQAGASLTTGANNIVLGDSTTSLNQLNLTTGSNNILIGNGLTLVNPSNSLDIGNLIFGSNLNQTGLSTGGIGIGTSTNQFGGALTTGLTLNNSLVLASSTLLATTTDALYNVNNMLYWNGSPVVSSNPLFTVITATSTLTASTTANYSVQMATTSATITLPICNAGLNASTQGFYNDSLSTSFQLAIQGGQLMANIGGGGFIATTTFIAGANATAVCTGTYWHIN